MIVRLHGLEMRSLQQSLMKFEIRETMAPRRSRIIFATPFDSQEDEIEGRDLHHQSASSGLEHRQSQAASSQASKSGRGPTQKTEVWGMREGKRLPIQFNGNGQPIGPNSAS